MIRAVWVWLVTLLATLGYGIIVIVAALLRVRGRVYAWATRSWARAILKASGARVHVVGGEFVREAEPRIIVANHASAYDIFALAAVLDVPFLFIAKKELERIPFFGTAWKAAGHISIDRADHHRAVESLRLASQRIREDGSSVIIFPEGTRSKDGRLQRFKKGAFGLAVQAGVPVVPAVVTGTRGIVGRYFAVRRCAVRVEFGEPLLPARGPGDADALATAARGRMLDMLETAGPSATRDAPAASR